MKRVSRLAEMTKTESIKINHEVANVTRSREMCVQPQPAVSLAARWYGGQVVTASDQATSESQNSVAIARPARDVAVIMLAAATKLQVSSSSQTSSHLRSSTACLVVNPCLRADSGEQDERAGSERAVRTAG